MTYYKFLNADRMPAHGGSGQWPEPGTWREEPGPIEMCQPGTLHVLTADQLASDWITEYLWEVEVSGDVVSQADKVGCKRARLVRKLEGWNERTARLFACDCAESALFLHGGDDVDERSIRAVMVARAYATGEATSEEMAAARAAAWDAAWDAERKWQNERLLAYAKGRV